MNISWTPDWPLLWEHLMYSINVQGYKKVLLLIRNVRHVFVFSPCIGPKKGETKRMQKHSSNVFLKMKRLFMNNIATSYPCTLGKTDTGFLKKKKKHCNKRPPYPVQPLEYWISHGLFCTFTTLFPIWLLATLGQKSFRKHPIPFQRKYEKTCTEVCQNTSCFTSTSISYLKNQHCWHTLQLYQDKSAN